MGPGLAGQSSVRTRAVPSLCLHPRAQAWRKGVLGAGVAGVEKGVGGRDLGGRGGWGEPGKSSNRRVKLGVLEGGTIGQGSWAEGPP